MPSVKKGFLAATSLGVIGVGAVAAVTILASASAAVPTKPAIVPGATSVSLSNPAQLLARGAAAGVPLSITCTTPPIPPGQSVSKFANVQISEVVSGNVVETGFGGESEFTCDGAPHAVIIDVIPGGFGGPFGSAGVRPFTGGTAFASAVVSVCTFPGFLFPPTAPFASPSAPPSPFPSPIPPIPPILPVCQNAKASQVITIQGDNAG